MHNEFVCAGVRRFDDDVSHQMEIFSALLALSAGKSPVTGEFPSQRPLTQSFDVFLDLRLSFDVFLDLRLNKRLSKQSWSWWSETPSRSLWRHSSGRWFSRLTQSRMEIIGKKSFHKNYWVFYNMSWLQRIKHCGWRSISIHHTEKRMMIAFLKKSNKLFLCMCSIISYRFLNMSVVSQTTLINQLRKPIFLSPKAHFFPVPSPASCDIEFNRNIARARASWNPFGISTRSCHFGQSPVCATKYVYSVSFFTKVKRSWSVNKIYFPTLFIVITK